MKIVFEEKAKEHFEYFAKHDRVILDKIKKLLREIEKDPYKGIGKPEPLKFDLSGYWSRRISKEHRLVYRIEEDKIIVISFRYHY